MDVNSRKMLSNSLSAPNRLNLKLYSILTSLFLQNYFLEILIRIGGGFSRRPSYTTVHTGLAIRRFAKIGTQRAFLIIVAATSSILGPRNTLGTPCIPLGFILFSAGQPSCEVLCFLRVSVEYRKLPRPSGVRPFSKCHRLSAYYGLC